MGDSRSGSEPPIVKPKHPSAEPGFNLGSFEQEKEGKVETTAELINRLDMLAKRAMRERVARKSAEKLLEEKSLELYKSNQELVNLTSSLQDQVELKTKSLKKALDEAKEANQLKSQFIATISHEMRTPLNAVIGFSERMLDSEDLEEETKLKYTRNIATASRQLLGLINDVLDFEKIASGKLEIESRSFNIKDIVESTIQTLEVMADNNEVFIGFSFDEELSEVVMGDQLRVQQVAYNLLSNAVKFSKGSFVAVECRWLSSRKETIEIIVADQGIGMTEEQLEKLFTPFTQADGSMARKFGGTGLGLSICKSLCELMGGDIWVYSKYGEGSEFHFTFDVLSEDADAGNDIEIPKLNEDIDLDWIDGAKVLLVDDQLLNQELGKELLEDMGAVVDLADDGNIAQEKALSSDYDVILMDLQMPECDGLEASQKILAEKPSLRIVALTANATSDVKEQCLDIGMCDFLGKPFVAMNLFQIVAKHSHESKQIQAHAPH